MSKFEDFKVGQQVKVIKDEMTGFNGWTGVVTHTYPRDENYDYGTVVVEFNTDNKVIGQYEWPFLSEELEVIA